MVHLIVVMMLVISVTRRVSSNYLLLHTNKIVTLTPTNVSPSASSRHCARKCHATYPCISYAYHPGRAQCYLYDMQIHKEDSTHVDNGTETYSFEFNAYLKNRLKGYEIWLAETGGCSETGFSSSTLCHRHTTNTAQNIYTINKCSQPNTQFDARYVFIYQPNHYLNLEEVEVVSWCT